MRKLHDRFWDSLIRSRIALCLALERGSKSGERVVHSACGPSARRAGADPLHWALMLSTIADSELFGQYSLTGYDEMFAGPGRVRPHYVALHDRLGEMGGEELASRDRAADLIMRHQGITFTVYGKEKGVEQIIPFDPIPRLIAADEWERIERGLEQRVRALNLFIHDVYHDRLILRDRTVPPSSSWGPRATVANASACGSRRTSTSTSRGST